MSSRNTSALKKLIYDTLAASAPLETLLTGSGRIRHGNPMDLSEYPLVVYEIMGESDEPYAPDLPTSITRTRVNITSFSNSVGSGQADAMDDEIYGLLHGNGTLTNGDIKVFSFYRASRIPFFEGVTKVWRVESRYDVVNVAL